MCIIAAIPAGLEIDKKTFMTCWDNNDDGFGMMYVADGKVVIEKSMIKKVAWRIYNRVRMHYPDSAKVLHFRIGTHGTTDTFNCHPFVVHQDELCVAHNGIISSIAADPEKRRSDTQMFNDLVLKKLPKDFYKHEVYYELIEDYIGQSKLVFLTNENEIYIMKKRLGTMVEGIWFSNETYKKSRYLGGYSGYSYSSRSYNNNVNRSNLPATSHSNGTVSHVYHQCAYCGNWTNDCKDVSQFGWLCKQCVPFLEEVGFELEEIEATTTTTVTNSITDKSASAAEKNDWSLFDEGDEYYNTAGY